MLALTFAMSGIAYLLGSVSNAVLISRLCDLPDPREYGSHNPGATNVLRSGNRLAALMVFLLDMLKGTIPVYLAWYLGITPFFLGLIVVFPVLGHGVWHAYRALAN